MLVVNEAVYRVVETGHPLREQAEKVVDALYGDVIGDVKIKHSYDRGWCILIQEKRTEYCFKSGFYGDLYYGTRFNTL